MIIEEEFQSIAKAIVDFKVHDFDVLKIISDYKHIESLRQEKNPIQSIIDLNSPVRNDLLKQIASLQEELSYSVQTMKPYNELFKLGCGLKQLQQLLNTLMEISLANNILVSNALPKFLKDLDEQYDEKLGFESAINNLRAEKEKLQAEVPEYKWCLQLQGVGPVIYHLNKNGVTNQDIINLNNLVLSFRNSNFIDDIAPAEGGNNTNRNGVISNNEFWKLFIEN